MSAVYASSSAAPPPPPSAAQPPVDAAAAGASRELNTRFWLFSVGLSAVFWLCFIFTFVAQYGLLSPAWFVPLILLVFAWLGHLIETMTSRSRRAFSTAGVASDVERWCDEYRATYPHFVYTVSCYHYETRTRTVRDQNGNYRTETYTVRVDTFNASDTIVPSFCVNCVFGEDSIAAQRTLITFHLDVEAGDQESADFLEQYRSRLYAENCWRDTHCDVSYTRDIPGWRGRYAALFASEQERARASQLMLAMFGAGVLAVSWLPRLWVHKNFGSHDISVAKRYFFSHDTSRLRTLLQSGVEMFQDAMELNHRAIVERHRKAAENGPFGIKSGSQQQQQQQDAQATAGTAPLSPSTAVPPPAYWMPSASYSVCVPNTSDDSDASPTMYAFDASQKHFVPYSSSAPTATPTAAYVPPQMPAAVATAPAPSSAAMPVVTPPTWGASAAVPAASVSVSAAAAPAAPTYASYSFATPQVQITVQQPVQQQQQQPQAQPQLYIAYGSSGYSTAVASTATPTSPPPQYVVQPV